MSIVKISSCLQERTRRTASSQGAEAWQPRRFDLKCSEHRHEVARLLECDSIEVHDTIQAQVYELIKARNPSTVLPPNAINEEITRLLREHGPLEYGVWIHFPWMRRLVHLLPEADFHFLRFNRNCYKITPEEQERLRSFTVGIVGLSVGKAAAQTLALEGVGGTFRLADFDTLSLSNLNRLSGGIHELGVNKAVLAARQMFEANPFLTIEIFQEGITGRNLDAFFDGEKSLDLLIEECDDLYAKIKLREAARSRRIPVIMDTSDRGLLDIERFDLEADRPLLHGLIGKIDAAGLLNLSTKDKLPLVLKILNIHEVSMRARASMMEIEESIESWPQLGSSVALGGALVADAARRVLLGHLKGSGRFYVDLETLIDPRRSELSTSLSDTHASSAETGEVSRYLAPPPPGSRRISPEEVRFLVHHACLAPSAGNCQPWRFEWREDSLFAFFTPGSASDLRDFNHCSSYVAFGAAAENIELAAGKLNLQVSIHALPDVSDPKLVFRACFQRNGGVCSESSLFDQVPVRVTTRRLTPAQPLTDAQEEALREVAAHAGAKLYLLKRPEELQQIGELIGCCDRLTFLNPLLHAELVKEVRWSADEARRTRDGIDIACLDLQAGDAAAMQLLSDPEPLAYLRSIDRGRGFTKSARRSIAAASAVGLITVEGHKSLDYFRGGRAVQRAWLTATALGLSFHPMTALPYLLDRLKRSQADDFGAEDSQRVRELEEPYRTLLPIPGGHSEVMLFRLTAASEPGVRSLRRRVEDVLTFC